MIKKIQILSLFFIVLFTVYAFAVNIFYMDFNGESPNTPSKYFSSFFGNWQIVKEDDNFVYAVVGQRTAEAMMAKKDIQNALALYGKGYGEFLNNLQAYRDFPVSIYKAIGKFENGTISVLFKIVSGSGAGIVFNIKRNGDYFVLWVNPLQKSLICFKMRMGRPFVIQWKRDIPIKLGEWHTLKVKVKDHRIEGYFNGKRYICFNGLIEGRVGLWAKGNSHVLFDNFKVKQE